MEPILNGAPGFILLAFVVALAGYLRQVSVNAQDRIEQIESDKHPQTWPKGALHTKAKLNALRNTKESIEWVTPFLFGFIVFIAFRSVLYALTRFFPSDIARQSWGSLGIIPRIWSDTSLKFIDLLVTLFLLLIVIMMRRMHRQGKKEDKKIANLRVKHGSELSDCPNS